jgi:hypothetical protein
LIGGSDAALSRPKRVNDIIKIAVKLPYGALLKALLEALHEALLKALCEAPLKLCTKLC